MFNKLKTGVGDLAGKAGELKSLGGDVIQNTAAEFNAVRPLFSRVGYRVGKVQVEIGISPKINFLLEHLADVDDREFDALLAEYQGNRVLAAVVAAIRQAAVLQGKVKFQGMRFAEVEVEIGIPPAIKLTFREDEISRVQVSEPGAREFPPLPEVEPPAEKPVPPPPEPAASVSPPPVPQAPAPEPAPPQVPRVPLVPVVPELLPLAMQGAPPAPAAQPAPPPPPAPAVDPAERERQREAELEALVRAGVAVRFTCTGCGKVLVVRAQYAGREGECRKCGTVHVIPAPSA